MRGGLVCKTMSRRLRAQGKTNTPHTFSPLLQLTVSVKSHLDLCATIFSDPIAFVIENACAAAARPLATVTVDGFFEVARHGAVALIAVDRLPILRGALGH